MTNPIENPGIPPIQPSRQEPASGSPDQAQPRPFSLSPEAPTQGVQPASTQEQPSPMDVAREGSKAPQWTQEEMTKNLSGLQNKLSTTQTQLQNPRAVGHFTNDHYNALGMLVDKLNPDMRTIAKSANHEFTPPNPVPGQTQGQGVLQYVSNWLNSSQGTLTNALNFVQNVKNPNPASYLKMQFAVQRATQRAEIFASIVGSSVSGIKTIMSTQLG
jgi:hypothetical protein